MTDAGPAGSAGEGAEPDPRYTFANERTFLAWSRTALVIWRLGRLTHHLRGRLELITATIVIVALVALIVAVTH